MTNTSVVLGIAALGTPDATSGCECATAAAGSAAIRRGTINFTSYPFDSLSFWLLAAFARLSDICRQRLGCDTITHEGIAGRGSRRRSLRAEYLRCINRGGNWFPGFAERSGKRVGCGARSAFRTRIRNDLPDLCSERAKRRAPLARDDSTGYSGSTIPTTKRRGRLMLWLVSGATRPLMEKAIQDAGYRVGKG